MECLDEFNQDIYSTNSLNSIKGQLLYFEGYRYLIL
jgi:hypothetical protein